MRAADLEHLAAAANLIGVHLAPLRVLSRLGNDFLARCSSLGALDLSPLAQVTQVGNSFLARCTSLRAVDFSMRVDGPC